VTISMAALATQAGPRHVLISTTRRKPTREDRLRESIVGIPSVTGGSRLDMSGTAAWVRLAEARRLRPGEPPPITDAMPIMSGFDSSFHRVIGKITGSVSGHRSCEGGRVACGRRICETFPVQGS
jgi:hypothetical protein